jgi:hypothetical protein
MSAGADMLACARPIDAQPLHQSLQRGAFRPSRAAAPAAPPITHWVSPEHPVLPGSCRQGPVGRPGFRGALVVRNYCLSARESALLCQSRGGSHR